MFRTGFRDTSDMHLGRLLGLFFGGGGGGGGGGGFSLAPPPPPPVAGKCDLVSLVPGYKARINSLEK